MVKRCKQGHEIFKMVINCPAANHHCTVASDVLINIFIQRQTPAEEVLYVHFLNISIH